MTTFIYILTDPITGLVRYVGKANNIKKRLIKHLCIEIKDANSCRARWISSLKKRGLRPIIEIIDEVQKSEWEFWERHYISLFRSWGFELVNSTSGGGGIVDGYWKGKKRSENDIQKMRHAQMGKKMRFCVLVKMKNRLRANHPMKGKKLSVEHKEKIKKSWENRPTSFNKEMEKINRSIGNKRAWERRKRMS